MNVEIGAEAALFPEKEYIRGFSLQCRNATKYAQVTKITQNFSENLHENDDISPGPLCPMCTV